MLEYGTSDVFEDIDIDKTVDLRECITRTFFE